MEKLLQLLNEYVTMKGGPYKGEFFFEGEDIFVKEDEVTSLNFTYFMISNKFGFIEWLTKNNKIRLMGDWEFFYDQDGGRYEEFVNWVMHLSIQDDPISFLVSILK